MFQVAMCRRFFCPAMYRIVFFEKFKKKKNPPSALWRSRVGSWLSSKCQDRGLARALHLQGLEVIECRQVAKKKVHMTKKTSSRYRTPPSPPSLFFPSPFALKLFYFLSFLVFTPGYGLDLVLLDALNFFCLPYFFFFFSWPCGCICINGIWRIVDFEKENALTEQKKDMAKNKVI